MKWFSNFFLKIRESLGDFVNDWREFWTHGPRRWFWLLWRDLREIPASIGDKWKRRGELWEHGPRRWFLSPWRSLREFPASFAEWRERRRVERSLRQSESAGFKKWMKATWDAYLSLLASLLNWLAFRWLRFRGRPLWVQSTLLVFCLLLIVGGVSFPWVWKSVKDYRSKETLAEARLIQESDPVEAYMKARAAALMRLDDPEALEFVMELSNEIGAPDAVWWSERLAVVKGYDGASMKQIVETALKHRLTDKARQSLLSLKLRHSDYVDLAETELDVLLAQRKFTDAFNLAIASLEAGADSPRFHAVAVSLASRSSSENLQNFVAEHLRENLFREDEVGIALARVLLHEGASALPQVQDTVDYAQVMKFVESHEEASVVDRIAATGLGLRAGLLDEGTAYEQIVSEYNLDEKADRITALEMLGNVGLYETYDQLITDEDLADAPEFVLLRMAGFLLGEPVNLPAAEEILAKSESGDYAQISEARRALWAGLIAARKGDQEAFEGKIIQAVEKSKRSEWAYLINMVERTTGPEETLIIFRELYDHSGRNPYLASRYLRLAYLHADEKELARLVRFLPLEILQRDEETLALLLYLKAVYDEPLGEGRRYAEKLVADNPRDLGYLLTLAHLYAKSEGIGYARRLVNSFTGGETPTNLAPRLQLSYAAVMGESAGETDIERLPRTREREYFQRLIAGSGS